jgi:hypothetical protein
MNEQLCGCLIVGALIALVVIWCIDNRAEKRRVALKKLSVMALAGHYAGVSFDALMPQIEVCVDLGARVADIQAVLEGAVQEVRGDSTP